MLWFFKIRIKVPASTHDMSSDNEVSVRLSVRRHAQSKRVSLASYHVCVCVCVCVCVLKRYNAAIHDVSDDVIDVDADDQLNQVGSDKERALYPDGSDTNALTDEVRTYGQHTHTHTQHTHAFILPYTTCLVSVLYALFKPPPSLFVTNNPKIFLIIAHRTTRKPLVVTWTLKASGSTMKISTREKQTQTIIPIQRDTDSRR